MPRGATIEGIREAVASALPPQEPAIPGGESPPEPSGSSLNAPPEPPPDGTLNEPPPGEPEPGDEERELSLLNEIPEALGWDPSAFYDLGLKLDREDEPVKLGQVKDRLQAASKQKEELDRREAELRQREQAFQQQAQQFGQQQGAVTERLQKAQESFAELQGLARSKVDEWAAREEVEPGKVANERQRVSMALMAAERELQAAQGEAQQVHQHQLRQVAQQQDQILRDRLDGYTPETRNERLRELRQFAVDSYGISTQEANRILDARTFLLLRDAMEYRKLKQEGEQAVSRIRIKPSGASSGVRLGDVQRAEAQAAESVKRASQNRSRETITDAVRDIVLEAKARGRR